MKTFEEIYQIVEESSNECAYNKEECRAMYDLLVSLPDGATVAEIGVQYGRSTSVIAEVGREKNFTIFVIDSWEEDVSRDAKSHFFNQIAKYNWNINVIQMRSNDIIYYMLSGYYKIDLLHIDGDHTYEGVKFDLKYTEILKRGGYVLFDDYGHDSLPDVYRAVQEWINDIYNKQRFDFVGRYGDKLGVFKRR